MLDEVKTMALKAKKAGHAVAFGEIGLDYDRLFLSPKEPQLKYFEAQLDLAVEIQLPLFLHSRAASDDFEKLLTPRLAKLPKRGLVHSFTGTLEEMNRMVAIGLDIGVNGCSLKTEENLEVVKAIPLDRIQIETDGPWVCEISSTCHGDKVGLLTVLERSAKFDLPTHRPSTWREQQHSLRPSRRRDGKRDAWSRVATNLWQSLMSPMSSPKSRTSPWRKSAKRKCFPISCLIHSAEVKLN